VIRDKRLIKKPKENSYGSHDTTQPLDRRTPTPTFVYDPREFSGRDSLED
jgi:hypothetical protein